MIARVVKMTFEPARLDEFKALFDEHKALIRGFDGCTHLQLLADQDNPHILYTYSLWESDWHLDQYRQSSLFGETWKRTKQLFAQAPEAFSLNELRMVEK